MKRFLPYILIICGVSGLGLTADRMLYQTPEQAPVLPDVEIATPEPEPLIEMEVLEAVPVAVIPKEEPVEKEEPVAVAPLSKEEQRRIAVQHYYDNMERNFESKLSQLDREKDPVRRNNLIRALARYVQIDTLEALDWATSLTDQKEKRAALEAINKNALTGIGARIETDETGLPKIRNTTILSAVESTGQIEPGDYISGMVRADGSQVSFEGWPLQKVAQMLRGVPGTEIQLQMERMAPDGSFHSFDVPVQRSLIVMQPTF